MKKILFSFLISITLFSGELKAQDVEEDSVFVYFFKSVVIGKMINVKSKNIVAIPYYASPPNIYFEDYFKIAEKYYPRITRDSLIKIIDQGKVIDQDPLIEGYTINVLNDYGGKYDVYKNSNSNPYKPHIFISPILFSPNGNSCILFAYIPEENGFTVEMIKNSAGKWASHKVTIHWIE
ncbi:MAG: hypothetical protein FGM61_05410 [Sediminibacterium sp.]|nr:hypothetical protein [Sediminibacterium sp.]